ncbi:hypothetical protein NBO_1115g0001 [Nosema bombycis CQ1]|uniref:Uncharacterized protein n=1 Tax=Nosema bombycis (strain CQ1 / CVCC 102059) TaxID=578461 RepID=R0KMZ3_NOSB1|nr:hypothetical protein NBO_1115g0001 [Nosema bombycis CQ1]|eukprot:EOB11507.1 hypothetical protein NBO_1115g0001 [Nosema bombycis CQ1]
MYIFTRIAKEHLEFIMSNKKREECVIIFKEIDDKLKILEDFVRKEKRVNKEIALDCDTAKVKSFLDKHFDLLYRYCEIMEIFDEIYLTNYVFEISSKNNPAEKILEQIYTDKLFSRELKKCLSDSYEDLMGLKIFSQTDYFKKDLSKNILKNLLHLIGGKKTKKGIKFKFLEVLNDKDKAGIFSKRSRIYSDQDDLIENEINELLQFYKAWEEILFDPYEKSIISMEDLVNGKKIGGNFLKRTLRHVRVFFMKYLFINLFILIMGIPILIRLIFKRNDRRELTFDEDDSN